MSIFDSVILDLFLKHQDHIINSARSITADLIEEDIRKVMKRSRNINRVVNQDDINNVYFFYISDYVELLNYIENIFYRVYGKSINIDKSFFRTKETVNQNI